MVFRRHGVMLAEGGEQRGKGVVVKGGRAEGAEAALYRDAHLLDDSGVCWRGQVMVAEGLSGGEDGALGAVGEGAVEVKEDDVCGHGVSGVGARGQKNRARRGFLWASERLFLYKERMKK